MIFISYSWKDRATVEIIEAALKRMGMEYWIDRKYLDLSYRLRPQISRAIKQSHQILCIGSKASQLSPWVRYELKIATKLGKKVLKIDANNEHLKPNNALHADKLLATLLVCR